MSNFAYTPAMINFIVSGLGENVCDADTVEMVVYGVWRLGNSKTDDYCVVCLPDLANVPDLVLDAARQSNLVGEAYIIRKGDDSRLFGPSSHSYILEDWKDQVEQLKLYGGKDGIALFRTDVWVAKSLDEIACLLMAGAGVFNEYKKMCPIFRRFDNETLYQFLVNRDHPFIRAYDSLISEQVENFRIA